jgi:hypothetical protein
LEKDKASILYLTDLYFNANGRDYYEEDLWLSGQLREDFTILLCHPLDSHKFEKLADLILFRNTGPTMYYKDYFNAFRDRVNGEGIACFNSMDGRADMMGKQYLVDLTKEQYPVIPTIERQEDLFLLPEQEQFIVKLKDGADSIGMEKVVVKDLATAWKPGMIVQPYVDFEYEVSFYFINSEFQYALYAPDRDQRWLLKPFKASPSDLSFAQLFIHWNTLSRGIQRVDACRMKDGRLLLVELEDLNPFLSLDSLTDEDRESFVQNLKYAILDSK